MSIVGPLAYRSALHDSCTELVPDLRDPMVRRQYADGHWNPDPTRRTPDDSQPSILGDRAPTVEALGYARKIWREHGYTGE